MLQQDKAFAFKQRKMQSTASITLSEQQLLCFSCLRFIFPSCFRHKQENKLSDVGDAQLLELYDGKQERIAIERPLDSNIFLHDEETYVNVLNDQRRQMIIMISTHHHLCHISLYY